MCKGRECRRDGLWPRMSIMLVMVGGLLFLSIVNIYNLLLAPMTPSSRPISIKASAALRICFSV